MILARILCFFLAAKGVEITVVLLVPQNRHGSCKIKFTGNWGVVVFSRGHSHAPFLFWRKMILVLKNIILLGDYVCI